MKKHHSCTKTNLASLQSQIQVSGKYFLTAVWAVGAGVEISVGAEAFSNAICGTAPAPLRNIG